MFPLRGLYYTDSMDKNPLQPQSGQGQTSLPEPIAHNEQLSPAPESAPEQAAPQAQQVQQPQVPPALTTPAPSPSAVQAEGDTLGQEWLSVVDSLVRQNIQDPRKLSKEFEKVKASYVSKRYGKELKQSDSEG